MSHNYFLVPAIADLPTWVIVLLPAFFCLDDTFIKIKDCHNLSQVLLQ
jgi:hypothetical protein